LVVLYTSGTEADWPDELDLTTQGFTYSGTPARKCTTPPGGGNVILRQAFDLAHRDAGARRIATASRGWLTDGLAGDPLAADCHHRGGGGSPGAITKP
jgi:hypothetical protein